MRPQNVFWRGLRQAGGWLALLACVLGLPGLNTGMTLGALDLIGSHRMTASALRGNDLVIVLHHPAEGEAGGARQALAVRPPDAAPVAGSVGAGGACDDDHRLVLPGTTALTLRGGGVIVDRPILTTILAATPVLPESTRRPAELRRAWSRSEPGRSDQGWPGHTTVLRI